MLPRMWSQLPWMNIALTIVHAGCGWLWQTVALLPARLRSQPSASNVQAGILPQS